MFSGRSEREEAQVVLRRRVRAMGGPSASVAIPRRKSTEPGEAEGEGAPERVGTRVSHAVVSARTSAGWKREQLARAVHERVDVIAGLETGEALKPTEALMVRLEKALRVSLPRR